MVVSKTLNGWDFTFGTGQRKSLGESMVLKGLQLSRWMEIGMAIGPKYFSAKKNHIGILTHT